MRDNRWNQVRFVPNRKQGHVESFFFIAQEPSGERALWIKATVLAPKGGAGDAQTSAWLVGFERSGSVWALKDSSLWREGSIPSGGNGLLQAAGLRMTAESIDGTIQGEGQAQGQGPAQIDLAIEERSTRSIALLFHDRLYDLPWPSFKLVSPSVHVVLTGRIDFGGGTWLVHGWRGMQGHNWGRRHADRYGWVFCNAWDGRDEDDLVVEAFSLPGTGPIGSLAGGLAGAVVLYQGRTLRFNGPVQLLWNRAWSSALAWGMIARGEAGRMTLRAWARPERTACLRYHNPDGRDVLCANSPLAGADLVLEFPDGRLLRRRSTRAVLELAGPRALPGIEILA